MNTEQGEWLAFAGRVLGVAEGMAGVKLTAITKGGSDRSFYRLSLPGGRTFLFMAYGRRQEENAYWADIAAFLARRQVPVPAVYGHDPEQGFILMEDLGDRDLWSYRHESWAVRGDIYRRVLRRISPLYTGPLLSETPAATVVPGGNSSRRAGEGMATAGTLTGRMDILPPLPRTMPGYDRELYRWEHDYFLAEFVREVCGIEPAGREEGALREELETLTTRMLAAGPALVHRDLQSQNIMMRGDEPVFIDFQGLRRGSLFYDLASLLYDSYVPFTAGEREELVAYAHGLLSPRPDPAGRKGEPPRPAMDVEAFRAAFLDGSAQRLMQALGAFGFLGLKKGKEAFLGHIPRGVANLEDAAMAAGRLPRLAELAARCRKAVQGRYGARDSGDEIFA